MNHPDVINEPPYRSEFIEVGGLRLHYLDYGAEDRPPMLCLHGGGANAHWFDFVGPDWSQAHHVYALDFRGHGDSAWAQPPVYSFKQFAQEVAEFVEKLDLRDFVLLGHSMGGMVSLVYAATYPGRVRNMIVVDSTMKISPERLADWRKIGTKPPKAYASQEEFIDRYRLRPISNSTKPEIVRYLAQFGGRQFDDGLWRHKFDRNVHTVRTPEDGFPYWERIKIPALVVRSSYGNRVTPEIMAQIKARCPPVEFVEVPGTGHHVMLDDPAGLTRAVDAFLAKHS